MKLSLILTAILVLTITSVGNAQIELLFNGVQLEESLQSAKDKMEPFTEKMVLFEV